jgi:RHS repeat-associated protein
VATSVTGSVPAFGFQGSWTDDVTKLSWVVTRWYAPAQGRFLSEDSLLGQPRDPDSRHLYAYGAGDPVGAWDPDGENWCLRMRRCGHDALYHGAVSSHFRTSLRNPTHLRGKFEIHLFISTKWSVVGPWWLKGDWRTYNNNIGCLHSRACMVLDFDNNVVRVDVRPTCERYRNDDNRYTCDSAKGINVVGFFSNAVHFTETSGGVVYLGWSLVPSMGPPLAPIDGFVRITPPGAYSISRFGRTKLSPSIVVRTDGYPTFDMYYRTSTRTWIIRRDWEGSAIPDLGPIVGDSEVKVSWP